MEKEKEKQRKIFMNYLEKDNSESNALIFVQKYTEFVLGNTEKEKQQYITKKRTEFLGKFSRAKVQEYVDKELATCRTEQLAYEYLLTP